MNKFIIKCVYIIHFKFIICLSLLEYKFQESRTIVLFTEVFQVPREYQV